MNKTNHTIKAIIFDLGRVLVDVDLSKGIFKYAQQANPKSEEQILDTLMRDSFYQDYACGKFNAEQFQREFCRRLNLDFDFEAFKQEWNGVFKTIPGMEALVAKLSENYKIGLLSDIGPLHWGHLKKTLPVLKQIEKPVLSYQIGLLKPEKAAYLKAAESVQTTPQSCLFIDDREVNVQGAKSAGMQSIGFSGIEQLYQDLYTLGLLNV